MHQTMPETRQIRIARQMSYRGESDSLLGARVVAMARAAAALHMARVAQETQNDRSFGATAAEEAPPARRGVGAVGAWSAGVIRGAGAFAARLVRPGGRR